MAVALAPRCEVLAVQYPGRQDRSAEKPLESIEEIADQLLPLLPDHLDGAFALFGHSMGATVAFELARRLQAAGTAPAALFASARPAPSRQPEGGTDHHGTDDELNEYLRTTQGTDDEVLADREFLALALPALRSDSRATETYRLRPGPKLDCPVHALMGDDDPMVTRDEARAWGEHSTGPFALHVYEGGHFYLQHHLEAVTGVVAAALAGPTP
jgi:surfactin synthase thioesterase subunit